MKAIELTADSFKEYGQLIHNINKENLAVDFPNVTCWSRVTRFELPNQISTSILIGHKRDFVISELERHFNTNEVIVALDHAAVLVVGTANPDSEKKEGLRAFYLRPGQGVVLEKAVWHAAPYPITSDDATFLILFADGTEENDLYFSPLEEPIPIEV